MSRAVPGSICTARMVTMIVRRPRNRNRDSAAEASNPSTIDSTTAPATTITLLRRLRRRFDCVNASIKLLSVGCLGKKIGVGVITSGRGLKAVLIIQYTCLLYTSDAADDPLCVDLGGRR